MVRARAGWLAMLLMASTAACAGPNLWTDGTSVSTGTTSRGRLRHPAKLPLKGPGFVVPPRWEERGFQYGVDELVAAVQRAAKKVGGRAKRGLPPRSAEEFAVYAQLVAREQQRDFTLETEVLARAMKWLDRRLARAEEEVARAEALEMAAEFAVIFAESMVIRAAGGQAVPLMLRQPALAILDTGELVAIRDWARQLHIAPAFTGDPAELQALMAATTAKVLGLREGIQDASRFDRHARALWERVRAAIKPTPQSATPPVRELEVPPDHQTKAWRTDRKSVV